MKGKKKASASNIMVITIMSKTQSSISDNWTHFEKTYTQRLLKRERVQVLVNPTNDDLDSVIFTTNVQTMDARLYLYFIIKSLHMKM